MISQRMLTTGPGTQEGTWVAGGAINDAGTAEATFTVVGQGRDRGRVDARHVLTSAAGTMTLDTRSWLRPFPPPTPPRQAMVEGTWRLIAATDAYRGLRARGRLYATVDRTTSPPEITIVRDGSAD
jgi:hypothetical protein